MGGQKGIALFCHYLGRQHQLTAVSSSDNDTSQATTYQMIPLFTEKRSRYLNPLYVRQIARLIKQKNIRHVITEHPYMAWMGFYLQQQLGVKWYVHSHNIEFERFKTLNKPWHPLLKQYERWAYRHADALFFKTKEDVQLALQHKMIDQAKAVVVPFGVEIEKMPGDIAQQKAAVYATHNIPAGAKLLFFNGTLDYQPNLEALDFILHNLNPLLLQQASFNYRLLICGKGLPASYNNLADYGSANIIYAGFVNDVYAYFKAADIFLNPVVSGGGVKTKIVEAMGYGATVISCASGAAGIEPGVCGEKLKVVADNDAPAFVREIMLAQQVAKPTPPSYYTYYYWGNIVSKLSHFFV